MKRLTRYVNRPIFGVTAGLAIGLALLFAFANIFNWLPPQSGIWSLLIRIGLGILVIGLWVLLNIPPPKLNGFVIALAQLVEEREPDGALYGLFYKARRNLMGGRNTTSQSGEEISQEEDEDEQEAKAASLRSSLFVKSFLRNRQVQPNGALPQAPSFRSLPSGPNQIINLTANAADAGSAANPGFVAQSDTALAVNGESEGTRLAAPPKKFDPPPALWKTVAGPRLINDYLSVNLAKKFNDANIELGKDATLFETDGFVASRTQALREGEYPHAGVIIWGWNTYGKQREFVPVFEMPEPLENRREQHKLLQILGLKSFELGPQTVRHSTVFAAFVSGLTAYALKDYKTAQSEFSLSLIAAYMLGATRLQDVGIDRSIVYFFLGNTQYYLRDYDTAVNSYREALALDAHMYEARHNLGICLYLQGRVEISIKRLIEVIQSRPNLAIARYNLGMAYIKKKQFVAARRELNNAIRINEDELDNVIKPHKIIAAGYRGIGLSYSDERSFIEATNYFEDALEEDPTFAEVHVDLAMLYYRQAEPELVKLRMAEREVRKAEQGRDQGRIDEARRALDVYKAVAVPAIKLLDSALPKLRDALKIKPDFAEAHYYLGLIYLQKNNEDEAGYYLLEAVNFKPDFADAHEVLADIYEARGRNDLRDKHLRLMGEARSATAATNAEALIRAGMAMRLNKQLPLARETLEKALRLEPRNAKAQYELGVVYLELDEPEKALGLFQSVLRLPDPPDDVYDGIAKIYRQQGQEQEAFTVIQNAATQKPKSPQLQYYLGNAYRRQQNNARAIEAYQRTINLDPNYADARFNLGMIYLAKRQLQDAALQFEVVVQLRPDDFTTYRYLGRAYVEMKRTDEAIIALERAIQIKDDALEARLELGQIYLQRAESGAAQEQFEAILKYDSNNMRAREFLGKAFAQGGQIGMAIETFQNMLLITPESHAAHYNLGVAFASENDYVAAAEEFQQVIQLKRDDADAYFNLGLAYDKLDKPHEAIASFQRAIQFRPSYAEAYRYMGQVYFKINDNAAGLKAVQYAEQLKRG